MQTGNFRWIQLMLFSLLLKIKEALNTNNTAMRQRVTWSNLHVSFCHLYKTDSFIYSEMVNDLVGVPINKD